MKATGVNNVSRKTLHELAVGTKVTLYDGDRAIIVESIMKKYNTKEIFGFMVISTISNVERKIPLSAIKEWDDTYNCLIPIVIEYWKKAGQIQVVVDRKRVGYLKKHLADAGICDKIDQKTVVRDGVTVNTALMANAEPSKPVSKEGFEVKLHTINTHVIVRREEITDIQFFSHRPDAAKLPERIINFFKNLFKW